MVPGRPLFSRIARSIQGRLDKLAEDNPDGALAKYLWLWRSMGRRPGRRLIPRPVRFFFAASLDLFSLVGWYVRTAILRVVRSARSKEAIMSFARTNRIAALTIVAGGVIGGLLTFSPLGSRSDDVPPVTQVLYESSATIEDLRLEEAKANAMTVYTREQIEALFVTQVLYESSATIEDLRLEEAKANAMTVYTREQIEQLLRGLLRGNEEGLDAVRGSSLPSRP